MGIFSHPGTAWKQRFFIVFSVTAAAVLIGRHPIVSADPPLPETTTERELLLNPRTSPSDPAAGTYNELRAKFADPPPAYRPMPLWVWNDELEWPRLREQLAQFREQGMGGVFVHPRPGLITEYLSEEWFRLWEASVEEGKRLGLLVNIYDENSYPSGFAGGHVPSLAPDTVVTSVVPGFDKDFEDTDLADPAIAAAFAVEMAEDGKIRSATRIRRPAEIPSSGEVLLFRFRHGRGRAWTAGFPYVDLTNPQTARLFLRTTYEAYKKRLGSEFGKTIRWAFTDEPNLANAGDSGLPLSAYTLAEFRRRRGYDLADHLPSLYWDIGDYRRVRFDYWETIHELWEQNFMRPMFEWCDRNNLRFTGHWLEHEWPVPWRSPGDAAFYAYQHMPGIDVLHIPGQGIDSHILFTIKQAASVAHQLGRRTFSETYGVGGWDAGLEDFKRLGDWVMVHGVNFVNLHLSFATFRGARKRDHPQSFSDAAAWWRYYRLHADHVARVSWALSSGEARHRVLVLTPTTSAFLHARRAGPTPEFEKMRRDNAELIQALADRWIDFDVGDEYLIEWFGGVSGRRFRIGRAEYHLLVWPPNMINVRRPTVRHLRRFLKEGGQILALGPPAAYVDGRPSEEIARLKEQFRDQWRPIFLVELPDRIRRMLEPRVRIEPPPPPGVGFAERFLSDGSRVLFFANPGTETVTAEAVVEGGALEEWDTVTGEISAALYEPVAGRRLRFRLELPPAGSRLFVVRPHAAAPPPESQPPRFLPVKAERWQIRPDSANVLVLDYCDLEVAGDAFREIHTLEANWKIWRAHGFEQPAWDSAVQFRNRVRDRNQFSGFSGFEAVFRFHVAGAAAAKGLRLVIETPELYRVTLNGNEVDFSAPTPWIDPRLGSAPVEQWVRPGENVVKITGRPFDVRMELENIYLLGNFTATPAEKGFRLEAPSALDFGSWRDQGYPFYGGSVLYESEVSVPEDCGGLRIALSRWAGSAAEILLDGRRTAVVGWPPYSAGISAEPGPHRVGIRVAATPRNLFGPFHNPAKPRRQAWPRHWRRFAEHQPPGARYDTLDYGLMSPPAIHAVCSSAGNE